MQKHNHMNTGTTIILEYLQYNNIFRDSVYLLQLGFLLTKLPAEAVYFIGANSEFNVS